MPAKLGALVTRANDILGNCTPIPADCGELCGAACCQGDELGMLLFPGEAPRHWRVPGFRVERVEYMDGTHWLLSCGGTCDRRLRPLSCRIFPLGPKIGPDGQVHAVPDPRARRMCPLAGGEFLDPRFRRRVERALRLLAQDPRMLAFLRRVSDEITELERFFL